MTKSYTGDPTGISPHAPATIQDFLDVDPCEAAIDNLPIDKLADFVAFLQKYAPIMGTGVVNNEGPLELAGASGDTNAALRLGGVPTVRKLRTSSSAMESTRASTSFRAEPSK